MKASDKQLKKKITMTQLKRYLPIKSPPFAPRLPSKISRYLASPSFSNLSVVQQNAIKHKYETVYRNYYACDEIVKYIDDFTNHKYFQNSIKQAITNCAQKYGVIDWYKLLRLVMNNSIGNKNKQSSQSDKIIVIDKIKQLFKNYLRKRHIWRGVQEVGDTKKTLDAKILDQLSKQVMKDAKQFVNRNRIKCQKILLQFQKQSPKYINFVTLQQIVNKDLQMYMDRKKVIYFYLNFDRNNRGFFATHELISQLLAIKKVKTVKKQTYYLTDLQQLMQRVRTQMRLIFYSSHEMENDFDEFYSKSLQSRGIQASPDDQIDPDIFYEYICEKCDKRYSRYHVDKIYKLIIYRANIHFLFNKPTNLFDLRKLIEGMVVKEKKKRILKRQNQVFYSFRTIILTLLTRVKNGKITREKFTQLINQVDGTLKHKAFYCVWRVYPGVINVQRMRKQCKLNQLACYLKLRRTPQEYEKIYESLIQMLPENIVVSYDRVQQKINLSLDFILDVTKIKPLPLGKYDQINYREAIQKIFQPDFQLDLRRYIYRKVSQKANAMWKAYKVRKHNKKMALSMLASVMPKNVMMTKEQPTKEGNKKMIRSKSKTSIKSKKQAAYNPQSLQIVQWNIEKLIRELDTSSRASKRQFHRDEHVRQYLCVNKRQSYQYRTLTPRYVMHPIPGLIGMGSDLMFLNKNKLEKIKIKFFYKPGIEVIDFTTLGNDVVILTSYFTLEFYSMSQQSNYSYQTIQLLDQIQKVNFTDLDNYCQDRMYSRFPIFIRSSGRHVIVNTAMVNNQIIVISAESNQIIQKVIFTQKQHIFTINTTKILEFINKSTRKSQLLSDIAKQLSKQIVSDGIIFNLLATQYQQQEGQGKLQKHQIKFTILEVKDFIKNMAIFPTSLAICILKQQFKLLKERKIPLSLVEVMNSVMNYMYEHNIALATVIQAIDKQNEGYIKMKSLKDYLLKITQQVYLANQKQLDAYLKNMTVGKNVEYEGFCEIMAEWKYQIWERPRMIIKDFIYIADCSLLIYTVETDANVYIKNMNDNLIVAILSGHSNSPSIFFIPESYMLITGDADAIRIWRIYEDLIKKYDQNPPWELAPYSVTHKAHDSMITCIAYLSRAHHLVTTSLDSTTKFWKIIPNKCISQQNPYPLSLQEVKRFYSNQCVYLSCKSNNISLDSQGCRLELLALAKISKQINQNNKYKYQMILQVFQVQNTFVQTDSQNIHLELPPKLKSTLEAYADTLGVKKNILLAKTISQYQNQAMKNNLITQNLQKTLFESVKNLFVFEQYNQLYSICKFLSNKNINSQIIRVLFQKYGVGIPRKNTNAPITNSKDNIIKPEQMQINSEQYIELPEDEIEFFVDKLKNTGKTNLIAVQDALNIARGIMNVMNYERFQHILDHLVKQNMLNSTKQIKELSLQSIIHTFKPYKLDTQIQRLYAILRTVNVIMKQKGFKIWNIFAVNKSDLEKKKKISQKQFQSYMLNLGLKEEKINLMISYLSKMRYISLDDMIYYTKLAWEKVGFQMSQSNFSKIFMKNSRMLKSKLEIFKLDKGIEVQKPQFTDKIKNLQDSVQANLRETLGSRKSSKNRLRDGQKSSQSQSVERQSRVKQKKRSVQKQQPGNREQPASKQMSSSNSKVSLSQSNAKDQFTRQVHAIVRKIKEMLKNQNKNLWDIISVTVPQFMDNYLITETEYFNLLASIKSPIYLSDKLKLMAYIMKESEEYSEIDLNILFQLFEPPQPTTRWNSKQLAAFNLQGEKYIITHLISKISEGSFILQHALNRQLFHQKQQLSTEQILQSLSQKPFNMLSYCLKQFQTLLLLQNKSAFTLQQFKNIVEERIRKYNIKVDSKQINFIQQIIHRIDNRGVKLEELIPKSMTNNGVLNYGIFQSIIKTFFNEKDIILQNEFIRILLFITQQKKLEEQKEKLHDSTQIKFGKKGSPKKISKIRKPLTHEQMLKESEIKYKDLINYINKIIQDTKKSSNSEKDGVKKFLKALQSKKINLLTFFVSLDRNRNYYINQIQFSAGLAELKVSQNFWASIHKKSSKKLFYFELINYLVQNQLVNYKCVDSELQAAMTKFVKKFIRNDDIQAVFDRLRAKQSNQPYNATYQSFQNALKLTNLFKQQQMFYIFGAFANAQMLKSSNFTNDNIIKDPANTHKSFNFKMFTDVVNSYKNQNITKSSHYKVCHFLKKRGISLLNQFIKWMERNKKIKEISQAMKIKQYILPRQLYVSFIKQLGTQLSQKQIKQMIFTFPNPLQFSAFHQKLEQIYKKGNSNIETQQIMAYLQQIYKKIKKLNVTTDRLFNDFSSDKFKMNIFDFSELIKFLQIGLTKIQNKMIFSFIDLQKKGYITLNQLQNCLQQAGQTMQKQTDDYQLDYIVQKLMANQQKFALKTSRIAFNLDRAFIIFSSILTNQQIILLYKCAQQHFKSSQITQKNMEQFLIDKEKQSKAKKDKKYKQLIINFLNLLKKINVEVTEAYSYFSKDTGSLTKNKFLLEYQSLGLKANMIEINALYSYLDQAKTGFISQQKWQDKLNVVEYEKDNEEGVSGEQLQVFYKVKLILSDIYLLFIRKLYKTKQIAAYFDINGTGTIKHNQFLHCIENLGVHLDKSIDDKLINYLDKQRNGQILITNLVYQLQNCLSSKTKLILQTKTSCIFKQKLPLIQQKQSYFIQRLVKSQHFLENNDKLQSCILVTQFLSLIKDFGIILGDDEFNDIQRNFKYNQDNLYLYPLYFMFINIFKSSDISLSGDQMERNRYQRLFQTIVKNGLSMKVFQKIKTMSEATIFLSQLKIFTPIQIKLIIQSIAIAGTNLIDDQLLIKKVRDSYLKVGENLNNVMMFIDIGSDRKQMMKEWLKSQLSPNKIIQILNANTGKINRPTFQNLMIKMGLVLKKSDVNQFFNIFSNNDDFILIQNLIQEAQEQPQQIHQISEQFKYPDLILDHICKSLDFKGVSLEQAWQKYFVNYGFISHENFFSFLNQIGFDYKEIQPEIKQSNFLQLQKSKLKTQQNQKTQSNMRSQEVSQSLRSHKQLQKSKYYHMVVDLLQAYTKQTKLNQLKTTELQNIMKRQNHVPQKQCRNQKYAIQSQSVDMITSVIHSSPDFLQNFPTFLQQQGSNLNKITVNAIFSYIKSFIKAKKIKAGLHEKDISFYTNLLINKNQITISQFVKNINNFLNNYYQTKFSRKVHKTDENQMVLLNIQSTDSLHKSSNAKMSHQKMSFEDSLKKICHQNFIFSYKQMVINFQKQIIGLHIPIDNKFRLCLSMVVENLLHNDYLLFLKPKLHSEQKVQNVERQKKFTYSDHGINFNMKTVANLIVEKQTYLQDQGIFLINDKYYGLNISQKKDFESMAVVASILDPTCTFLRAKNYYLWEPNDKVMPKLSINYRWKYIPVVLIKICKQISNLQQCGYVLPHLRWIHLHNRLGISKVPFPAHADATGKIVEIPHQSLLKIEDPYCPPQFYRQKKTSVGFKMSTWIFGCLMYEFIWGHPPNSFIIELLQHIQSRQSQFQLSEVLNMEQLPNDFQYAPFKYNKIKEVLAFQHELKAEGISDDLENNIIYFGLRGLIKNLQILYGSQFMYYRTQFVMFQKMHELILQCLDPNPQTRPNINAVLKVLADIVDNEDFKNFQYGQYIEVLSKHEQIIELDDKFIDRLRKNFMQGQSSQIQQLSNLFYDELVKVREGGQVKQIYLIPKRYPWPDKQNAQAHSQNMLQNQTLIRSHQKYNIICQLLNQNCLEMIINLYVNYANQNGADPKKVEQVFITILKSIMMIIQMLRSYSTPFSGYVANILQAFIQLYYRQAFFFTTDDPTQVKSTNKNGLMIVNSNGSLQQRAQNLIKRVIYLNGAANVEYLPIYYFLQSNRQYQMLYQFFYCSIDLQLQPNQIKSNDSYIDRRMLAINYFRDRIFQQYFWDIVKYIKIDILMLKLLDDESLTLSVLLFFKDVTCYSNCLQLPLISSNIFYLKLGYILSQKLTSLDHKITIIEIASNILRLKNIKVANRMSEPSFGMIKQIFKLLVEPMRDSPLHEQFMSMLETLSQFIHCLKQIPQFYSSQLDQIQGVETILNSFDIVYKHRIMEQQH